MKSGFVILIGLFALLYLLNPGAGLFELIPDNIPIIGNLDEAAAVYVLLACFNYFGFDVVSLFSRRNGHAPGQNNANKD